jgi:hypothetical protein
MNIITNYGPKTWTENREDGVIKSLTVKIRGWRIINNNDGSPKTYKEFNTTRDAGDGYKKFYKVFDFTTMAEVEETHTYTVPEEHQTDKVFYLNAEHVHDHTQGDDGDIEYQTKEKEWRKDLGEDSDFLAKIESVKTQLEALGE